LDHQGLLWVFTLVAAADYQTHWRNVKPLPPGTGEVEAEPFPEIHQLYETMIEVIDLQRATVITRLRHPEAIRAVSSTGQAASYSLNRDGVPQVDIWDVGLVR